ncbi:hypothetical protein [Rubinisphaera italica]|uniref:Uncharacterized protein n=1 Tax=Rubinisphaera italica TaxID=2527969 RepID=A0A5C5XC70_9PLAN|nr:hypothetical protein [Rubinisphaera italica]TWT59765.1 hypothetical protein Pan54_04750 [Rubinisphaera italica]
MQKSNQQAPSNDPNESTRQFVRLLASLVARKLKEHSPQNVSGTTNISRGKSHPT